MVFLSSSEGLVRATNFKLLVVRRCSDCSTVDISDDGVRGYEMPCSSSYKYIKVDYLTWLRYQLKQFAFLRAAHYAFPKAQRRLFDDEFPRDSFVHQILLNLLSPSNSLKFLIEMFNDA